MVVVFPVIFVFLNVVFVAACIVGDNLIVCTCRGYSAFGKNVVIDTAVFDKRNELERIVEFLIDNGPTEANYSSFTEKLGMDKKDLRKILIAFFI